MAGIFDSIFGSGNNSGAGGTTQATPATPATPTTPVTPAEPAEPAAGSLESFAPLWTALDKQAANPDNAPLSLGIDPAKVAESLKNANLAVPVTADVVAAIQAGGDGAVQALHAMLNKQAQQGLVQSTVTTSKLVEAAMAKMEERMNKQFAATSTTLSANDAIVAALPGLANPATKPLLDTVRAGILANEPTLSANEVAEKVKQYFTALAQAATPTATAADASKSAGDVDWFARLGLTKN